MKIVLAALILAGAVSLALRGVMQLTQLPEGASVKHQTPPVQPVATLGAGRAAATIELPDEAI